MSSQLIYKNCIRTGYRRMLSCRRDRTEFVGFGPMFITRVAGGFSGFAQDQHAILRGATQGARCTVYTALRLSLLHTSCLPAAALQPCELDQQHYVLLCPRGAKSCVLKLTPGGKAKKLRVVSSVIFSPGYSHHVGS